MTLALNFLLAAAIAAAAPAPLVEQHVDTIAVCHVADGAELVFFFDSVQGEWTCLDHRWLDGSMAPGRCGGKFSLAWHDCGDDCDRLITAEAWVESWETENPLAAMQQGRPWFRRLLYPGLKPPGAR